MVEPSFWSNFLFYFFFFRNIPDGEKICNDDGDSKCGIVKKSFFRKKIWDASFESQLILNCVCASG